MLGIWGVLDVGVNRGTEGRTKAREKGGNQLTFQDGKNYGAQGIHKICIIMFGSFQKILMKCCSAVCPNKITGFTTTKYHCGENMSRMERRSNKIKNKG